MPAPSLIPAARPSRGGRPSLSAARARDERLLVMAGAMFEERGYEGTSMAALAEAAAVGKATLYARYSDKRSLFLAVYRSRIAQLLSPLADEARLVAAGPKTAEQLAAVLTQLGLILLRRSLSAAAMRVQAIIWAEAGRFPELAELTHREGWGRIVNAIGAILRVYTDAGIVAAPDPDLAADLFLAMVVGRQQRALIPGAILDEPALAARTDTAVRIFLAGVLVQRRPG